MNLIQSEDDDHEKLCFDLNNSPPSDSYEKEDEGAHPFNLNLPPIEEIEVVYLDGDGDGDELEEELGDDSFEEELEQGFNGDRFEETNGDNFDEESEQEANDDQSEQQEGTNEGSVSQ
ncbi:OLC1v1024139C1 [Oldenlandia corymbosa var. corymbosa]|uniref:OLC1v1024139C1 n=1 Tax=Oldenlandia corymbosa var. corymbosa TaxID=529605 RepID=A0AAV1C1I9_OLDCO|nr:OLC1v1024139C1 [Oldenlandia corymbosa var. corymbosa]